MDIKTSVEDTPKNIIMIDDRPRELHELKNYLQSLKYNVVIEDNVDHILNFSVKEMCQYTVFIVDYDMPKMCADKLIPRIKEKNLQSYVIVYTAFPNLDRYTIVRNTSMAGADFWVGKLEIFDEKIKAAMLARIKYAFDRLENWFLPEPLERQPSSGNGQL